MQKLSPLSSPHLHSLLNTESSGARPAVQSIFKLTSSGNAHLKKKHVIIYKTRGQNFVYSNVCTIYIYTRIYIYIIYIYYIIYYIVYSIYYILYIIYIYIYAQRPPLDPQFPCVFHRTSWSYRATDASARICQQQSSYIILYLQFEHVIIIHEQDSRHENWALLETPPTRKQGELRVLAQSRCLAIHWWRHGSVFAQTKLM